MSLRPIEPQLLNRRLDQGSAILIDIREADEFRREHIAGARLVPLSQLDAADFSPERASGMAVVFHCRSGNRTAANAARIEAKGIAEAHVLAGGLDAWKAAGLPTVVDRSAPIDLQRQVQIGAGSMALLGAVLGLAVSPWFVLLSAFVGAGLILAGVSGFCGLARVLRLMPWNRRGLAAAH
jgi:rhodanese-related sulfurtransferase